MATYEENGIEVLFFDPLSGEAGYLAYGTKWGAEFGTGVTITFSFPTSGSRFLSDYDDEISGWSRLSDSERTAVRSGLAEWAKTSGVAFKEVADNALVVGEFRFAKSSALSSDEAAHAYLPWNDAAAGDVWFNTRYFHKTSGALNKGKYDYLTILHEIGHSLGLKHSFEGDMPPAKDNYFYTVMSYTASPWSEAEDNYASFYPTTPMYYDLLAMQTLYGKDLSVNNTNSTYTFKDGTRYWQAINDTGGIDTIVYSGSESSRIDLNPGKFSSVSERIYFNGGSSRATVTIGPDVVIENATGGKGNDTLIGNDVANVLNGGAGRDTMRGGAGNDVYYVDNIGDIVDEGADGTSGTDTVKSYISFSLANTGAVKGDVEKLTLVGSGRTSGTGNALDNIITGNSANNTLTGGAGNDVLNGSSGSDRMRGGSGDDVYYVSSTGDVVDEALSGSGGIDTVRSSISFSLANTKVVMGTVENLVLTGTAHISGTGNALANTITGNSGNNTLTGGAGDDVLNGGIGRDVMRGGIGNDLYYVDNSRDVVDESVKGSGGQDTVISAISFSLANTSTVKGAVEHLTLTGSANLSGTGNALDNNITGNDGDNVLNGGADNDFLNGGLGNDQLAGGAGHDTFVFNTIPSEANVDTVSDFDALDDFFQLDSLIFLGLQSVDGRLSGDQFRIGTAAICADDRIVYDIDKGVLVFDSDGVDGSDGVVFAKLANGTAIASDNFWIV